VSEDALAQFELSAMGMRTVFDSAFDEIIRVDYLGWQEAQTLLDRLIIGLPKPYAALAFVLSGGLARQLVRTANQIAVMGRRPTPGRPMSEVAGALVARQLLRTSKAAVDQLIRAANRQLAAELVHILDDHPLQRETLNSSTVRAFEKRVRDLDCGSGPEDGFISNLREEVAAMTDYLATVLEVFNNQLDEQRFALGSLPGPGHFDSLARARRYLGVNPRGTEEILGAFRATWNPGLPVRSRKR
jgi:hypothetical protein